jgi:hypothetical protein
MLSEVFQSERWSGGDGEIHRHETTSSVAAPLIALAETRQPARIALHRLNFQ